MSPALKLGRERTPHIGRCRPGRDIEYVIARMPGVAYYHEPLHRLAADVVPRFS